jgi:hypothetical protein
MYFTYVHAIFKFMLCCSPLYIGVKSILKRYNYIENLHSTIHYAQSNVHSTLIDL